MPIEQLIFLALIQGATEWLPVSSSAHLIVLPRLMGMADQGPLIDAMAHLGSLGAVLAYFWRDVVRVTRGGLDLATAPGGNRMTVDARLFLLIALATPPGILAGVVYAMTDLKDILRNLPIIAAATIGFGILLWIADVRAPRTKTEATMTWRDAILIGLAQAIAFIPGSSRSGVTMTAARFLGFDRSESARFSMLCGVPLIAAGGAYALLELASDGDATATLSDGLWVAGLSFLAAYASIWGLMALLKRMSFLPFVLYRMALGAVLLLVAFG